MSTFSPNLDLQMHYEIDDHTDPWSSCETVMLMQGNAESLEAWRKLIPSSKLLLLKGSSYHPAASDADICSNATLKFIQDHPIVI